MVKIPVVFGHEYNRVASFQAVPFSTTVTPIKTNDSCSQISIRNRNSHYMEMPTFCTWTLIPMPPPGYPPNLHRQPDCRSMQRANIIRFLLLPSASKKKPLLRRHRIPKDLQFHYRMIHKNVTSMETNLTVDWTIPRNRKRTDDPEGWELVIWWWWWWWWWWRRRHMVTEALDANVSFTSPQRLTTTRSHPGTGLHCCGAVGLHANLKEYRFNKILPTPPLCVHPPPKMRPAFKIKWGDGA